MWSSVQWEWQQATIHVHVHCIFDTPPEIYAHVHHDLLLTACAPHSIITSTCIAIISDTFRYGNW